MRTRWLWPLLIAVLLIAPVNAQAVAFNFNWLGAPAAPLAWTPGAVNDWDLLATNDLPSPVAGTMQAQHGADCSAPPATHQVSRVVDSAFICNNHLMTAIFGGGDAGKGYAAAYFTPAQMVDMSAGTATVSWRVSTARLSDRDWWDLWLTPFSENLVAPLQDLPAFNGPPKDAVHVFLSTGICNNPDGQSIADIDQYVNFQLQPIHATTSTCVEDQVPPSAVNRSVFQLDVSQTHVRLSMPFTGATLAETDLAPLASSKAVVTWGHHSYVPEKGFNPGGAVGQPNTWHWSDVSINPSVPFTMLRPCGTCVLNSGTTSSVTLPQPAPANAFLRFAAIGSIQVSLDGGGFQPAVRQAQAGAASDGFIQELQDSSYFMPIPAGTRAIAFQGQAPAGLGDWWVQDVSVWA